MTTGLTVYQHKHTQHIQHSSTITARHLQNWLYDAFVQWQQLTRGDWECSELANGWESLLAALVDISDVLIKAKSTKLHLWHLSTASSLRKVWAACTAFMVWSLSSISQSLSLPLSGIRVSSSCFLLFCSPFLACLVSLPLFVCLPPLWLFNLPSFVSPGPC